MESSVKKRKTVTDFFSPLQKRIKTPQQKGMLLSTPVPGLNLYKDFVSLEEEKSILTFLNSEKCTWRTDLSRKTMHFGGQYCLMPPKEALISQDSISPGPPTSTSRPQVQTVQAPSMPSEFSWLIQRMVSYGIYPTSRTPQYCIVNCYSGSLGISAHTENFSFSQPVVGLSLLSSCPIRFHEMVEPFDGSVRSGKARLARRTGRKVD
ncbi:hypothetical protein MMC06_006852, partial [Schaereria dolodes]|nr:hypothetical protein [Schaereria dolodes]